MGVTDGRICPVKEILSYLAMRGGQAGPLFVMKEGKGLIRQMFSSALNALLLGLKRIAIITIRIS